MTQRASSDPLRFDETSMPNHNVTTSTNGLGSQITIEPREIPESNSITRRPSIELIARENRTEPRREPINESSTNDLRRESIPNHTRNGHGNRF